MWEPMECKALVAGVAEEASLGEPGAVSGTMPSGSAGPGMAGAGAAVGDSLCIWSDSHRSVTQLMPGAGWALERLTDASPIAVELAVAGWCSGRMTAPRASRRPTA